MTTARERARADVMAQILAAGRHELAERGADGLSLRAVARQVGMVSSAVYRYVASRDDLLTALIVEAYNDLGECAERAAAGRGTPGRRFVRVAAAMRQWALTHRQQWALLYGSPVPGYRAPSSTIAPAGRAIVTIVRLLERQCADAAPAASAPVSAVLRRQCAVTRTALDTTLPDHVLLRLVSGWTALVGFISAEMFGQLANTFDPADAAADHTFALIAAQLGFAEPR